MSHVEKNDWRVFCAVELPEDVGKYLASYAAQLRASGPKVKASWNRSEKVHMTLKFLGHVKIESVPQISEALDRAVDGINAFALKLGETNVYPNARRPRVLAISLIDETGSLMKLKRSVEAKCSSRGFAPEDRVFRPHVTVARIRLPDGARELAQLHLNNALEAFSFPVSEVVLFRSELGAEGSQYTAISRHRFVVSGELSGEW